VFSATSVVLKKSFTQNSQRIHSKLAKEKSLAIQLCVLSDLCGLKKVSRKVREEFTQNSQRKTLAIQLCVLSDLCGLKKVSRKARKEFTQSSQRKIHESSSVFSVV